MKNICQPYNKPNANPLYIHPKSNHPSIIKHIPSSIVKQISINSANERLFYEYSNYYNKALKNSGYKCPDIKYKNNNKNNQRRNRKIIWYTHPFNKMVTSKNINFLF